MPHKKSLLFMVTTLLYLSGSHIMASNTMTDDAIKDVKRADVDNEADKKRLEQAAVLLANYEISAGKLIDRLDQSDVSSDNIHQDATRLLVLSEDVIESARFRLPQCNEYLAKTVAIKGQLGNISHAALEKDYHHDGALPKAPAECYHTKDLFVHPATVMVLTRDDPGLETSTRESIKAEINEVLAHTEVVRQLVFY